MSELLDFLLSLIVFLLGMIMIVTGIALITFFVIIQRTKKRLRQVFRWIIGDQ